MSNDTWDSVLHLGPATFLNSPVIQAKRDIIKERGVKAALLGVPFDGTTITRTGSTMGPRRVRDCSSLYIQYHMDYDLDLVDVFNMHDCGDVRVKIGNAFETVERGKNNVLEILHGGAVPILIGGEHLITVCATRAFEEFNKDGNYGFILFDAHLDTANDVDGDIWNHCCPVTRTLELNCFNSKNTVIVGPSGAMNPKAELEYVKKNNIALFTMRDIYDSGIKNIISQAIKIASAGTDGVYISFDMDCLEASQTPGTCAPTPGGIMVREIIQAIDLLGEVKLIGFDVVEIAPPYDHSDLSAITATRIIVDMLGSHGRYLK